MSLFCSSLWSELKLTAETSDDRNTSEDDSMPRSTKKHRQDRNQVADLEQIPNIGPAIAEDLRLMGIARPDQLVGRDPYAMYDELCRMSGKHHDPCVLDVFLSAVRFMEGAPKRPWWKYTVERKRELVRRG